MRGAILGAYGSLLKNASARAEGWEVSASAECRFGMTAMVRGRPGALICLFGDRSTPQAEEPDTAGDARWLHFTRTAMLRGCGAVCEAGRLFLWTDESAACPLFYCFDEAGRPAFASRAKLLADLMPEYRCFVPVPGRPLPLPGQTLFRGIHAVPPGSILCFTHTQGLWGLTARKKYFELPVPETSDFERSRNAIRRGLTGSVARAVEGVSRVHVALSGGVDSSSIAALARSFDKDVFTYTVGSPYGDEFGPAAEAATRLKSTHREVQMTADDLSRLLPDLICALETWDPVTLQIAAPLAFLYRKIHDTAPIFLTGYGADLIFAGVADTTLSEERLEQSILEQVRLTVPTNEFSPSVAADQGITVRHPYWSPAMLAIGLSIRGRLKVRDGNVKCILRSAAEAWLPRHIAWRRKIGIHEGSAMHRMFSECLGATDLESQTAVLRRMAESALFERPHPISETPVEEVAQCASY
jgi:carbapenam-3-carboxylate synthase